MKKIWPPVCYHPTKIVCVDDDLKHLKSLAALLKEEYATCELINRPQEALTYLTGKYPSTFTKRCIKRPEESEYDHRVLDINTRQIHREMYFRPRFDEVGVVIVDYAMPGLNGIELCKKLSGLSFKTILLTGIADENIAVEAFNNGLIDKYIRKDARNFANTINDAVCELQKQYFIDLSAIVVDSITQDYMRDPACLDDPIFVDFFNKLCNELKPCEYYLMDSFGSYIFLDMDANPSWLTIRSEEMMRSLCEHAEICEHPDEEVVIALNNRTKIPYFHTDDEIENIAPDDWAEFLHPASLLSGRDIYYYSVIKDPTAYNINKEKIFTYSNYLDQLN